MKRAYPKQPIPAAGAVVVRRATEVGPGAPSGGWREVLLIRRGVEPAMGKWSFPGGAIELGETARDAAKRETREECGLEVEILDVLDVFDVFVRDEAGLLKYHYVIVDYLAEPVGGTLRPDSDVVEARWVPLSEVERLDVTSGTRLIVRRLLERGQP